MNNLLNDDFYKLNMDFNQLDSFHSLENGLDLFPSPPMEMSRTCSSATNPELQTPELSLESDIFEYSSMEPSSSYLDEHKNAIKGEDKSNGNVDEMIESNEETETAESEPKEAKNGKKGNSSARKRIKFSNYQLNTLEQSFLQNNMPSTLMRRQLAKKLNLTSRCVQVWFQNRRAKSRCTQKHTNIGQMQSFLASSSHPSANYAPYYSDPFKPKTDLEISHHSTLESDNNSNLFPYPGFYSIPAIPNHHSMYATKFQQNPMMNNMFSQQMSYPKFTSNMYHDENNCMNAYDPSSSTTACASSSSSSGFELPNLGTNLLPNPYENAQPTSFYDMNVVQY